MSCALTQDLSFGCRDGMGGLQEVYAAEFDNVSAITVTAGVVTALTKATGKKFWKWSLPRETGEMSSELKANDANGSLYYDHSCKIAINKLTTQNRNEILIIAKAKLILVGKDQNGVYWMLGRVNGMLVSTGKMTTGVQHADRNGTDLEFIGAETEPMLEVEATVAAALQTAGT